VKPVPIDVVTGFLGAGKTTLLAHVLGGALGQERVAVVINEIGDVSIDGRVIERLEHVERMVELDSGCVCCTIDDYRFEAAIHELVERADPTLIVIETTGVADPRPVCERIARAGMPLDAIITMVDAANLDVALRETAVAGAQIRAADFLVVNKTDLVTETALARVRRRLGRLNRRALVVECERGSAEVDVLFATAARRYRAAAEVGTVPAVPHAGRGPAHEGDGLSAFSWRGHDDLDQRRFERFLGSLPPTIYRAKGVVRFSGAGWPCLFNFTCGRYELNWIQLDGAAAQAVFIGREVAAVRDSVLQALEACEAG
jgi:G3E family GTPase